MLVVRRNANVMFPLNLRLVSPLLPPPPPPFPSVDPMALNLPDYFDKIKKPMDLGTVRNKFEKGFYSTAEQFMDDVQQIFENCYTYNPPNSDVCIMAKQLENVRGGGGSQPR